MKINKKYDKLWLLLKIWVAICIIILLLGSILYLNIYFIYLITNNIITMMLLWFLEQFLILKYINNFILFPGQNFFIKIMFGENYLNEIINWLLDESKQIKIILYNEKINSLDLRNNLLFFIRKYKFKSLNFQTISSLAKTICSISEKELLDENDIKNISTNLDKLNILIDNMNNHNKFLYLWNDSNALRILIKEFNLNFYFNKEININDNLKINCIFSKFKLTKDKILKKKKNMKELLENFERIANNDEVLEKNIFGDFILFCLQNCNNIENFMDYYNKNSKLHYFLKNGFNVILFNYKGFDHDFYITNFDYLKNDTLNIINFFENKISTKIYIYGISLGGICCQFNYNRAKGIIIEKSFHDISFVTRNLFNKYLQYLFKLLNYNYLFNSNGLILKEMKKVIIFDIDDKMIKLPSSYFVYYCSVVINYELADFKRCFSDSLQNNLESVKNLINDSILKEIISDTNYLFIIIKYLRNKNYKLSRKYKHLNKFKYLKNSYDFNLNFDFLDTYFTMINDFKIFGISIYYIVENYDLFYQNILFRVIFGNLYVFDNYLKKDLIDFNHQYYYELKFEELNENFKIIFTLLNNNLEKYETFCNFLSPILKNLSKNLNILKDNLQIKFLNNKLKLGHENLLIKVCRSGHNFDIPNNYKKEIIDFLNN